MVNLIAKRSNGPFQRPSFDEICTKKPSGSLRLTVEPLQDTNLVSQCEDLQSQGRARSKHGSHSSEQRPNQEHQERHYGEATNSHHLKQIGVYDRHT